MAGLIKWKKVAIPASNPDGDHLYVGIDITDGILYTKNSAGDISKYPKLSDFDDVAFSGDHDDLLNIGTNSHAAIDSHITNTSNPHATTKSQVGLGNADNTSDVNKPVSTAQQTALNLKINLSEKGAVNGITPLDADQKVPAIYLPSYVDDVLEYPNLGAFPVTGESHKMYIAIDTSKIYRWSGSIYVEIVSSPGTTDNVPEGSINLYFTVARVLNTVISGLSLATGTAITAVDSVLIALGKLQKQISDNLTTITNHTTNISNPHATTKIQIGLSNVPNVDATTTVNIVDSLNKRFVTDTEKASIDVIGKYTTVHSATAVTTPINNAPSVVSLMTLAPVAGTHKVTFNGQYSATVGSPTAQAAADLTTAYNYIQGLTPTGTHIPVFGTQTITPGVYTVSGAGSITTMATVTLDGQGNPNAIFVFRMSGAFSTGASAVVTLINGAQASNVFWVAQGAISLGASTTFVGTLISQVAATAGAGCIINGRLSSLGGAIGITTSTVTKPSTASQIVLGSFNSFALFTNSGGVGATGACTVTGDIGTNAGAITGFETSTVNGNFYTTASVSSALIFGIYKDGILVTNSSREVISSTSVGAAIISLDVIVTTTVGQTVDVRVKVDNGTFTTRNRNFTTVQVAL